MEMTKERVSVFGNGTIEMTQSKQQKRKKKKDWKRMNRERALVTCVHYYKRSNICAIGVPGEKKKGVAKHY